MTSSDPIGKLPHQFDYTHKTFESWKDVRNYLFDLEERNLYSGNVFRGHSSEEWRLEPSLNRIIAKPIPAIFERWHIGAEAQSVERFQMACRNFMPRDLLPEDDDDQIEWFSLMQHYGTPTRLLDITSSPFVAAFFALTDIHSRSELSCLWTISLRELDEQNVVKLGVQSDDKFNTLQSLYKQLPFGNNQERHVVAYYYPQRPSQRPFSQKGGFLYALDNDHDFEKALSSYDHTRTMFSKIYIKRTRKLVIDALKDFKIMNISFAGLLGGLDGYAKDIATDLYIINS
jgi:hypothetical protein